MKIVIEGGSLFVGARRVGSAGAGSGRPSLRPGCSKVKTDFSDEHDADLLYADGYGWIGPTADCDVVLGQVRRRAGVIPCLSTFCHVFALVEIAEKHGDKITLEVV
jgi:hypothetical protein